MQHCPYAKSIVFFIALEAGALGATVPFTEDFDNGSANWANNASQPLDWIAAGGVEDGAFATTGFNFAGSQANADLVMIRGSQMLGASGGAFSGNWITNDVTNFDVYVRHDAAVPLTYFVRFASPLNFPGAVAIQFAPVPPHTWTLVQIPIEVSNPQFVTFEGSTFASVFDDIGNVQIGVRVPQALGGMDVDVHFGVDRVSIVPEPAVLMLLNGGTVLGLVRRSRRLP